MKQWPDDDVILYDGVCVFCSRWIRFIAARDSQKRFRFTAIQSAYGTRLAQAVGIDPDDPDTNAVVHAPCGRRRSRCATRSTAWSRAIATGFSASMRSAFCPMRT
jgi:predicted DCC family thiol-disulfide oxidoreductase YuxK